MVFRRHWRLVTCSIVSGMALVEEELPGVSKGESGFNN